MQIITTLIVTTLIFLRYIFFEELKINAVKEYYFYYIVLTIIVTMAEIPLDIFVSNIIECWSGLKLSDKLASYKKLFWERKRFWAVDDTQHYLNKDTKNLSLIKKLGFSYQYFLILSLTCFSAILCILGVEMISLYNYNPLTDSFMIILGFLVGFYFIGINFALKKACQLYDQSKPGNDIAQEKEYHEIAKARLKTRGGDIGGGNANEMELLEAYLIQNKEFKQGAEGMMDELKQNLKKNFDKYKTVKDSDELTAMLLSDYLTNNLYKTIGEGGCDSEVTAMNIVYNFIKQLEYNKLNQEKLSHELFEKESKRSLRQSGLEGRRVVQEKFANAKENYLIELKNMKVDEANEFVRDFINI
jgi:hypothetical protein